MINYIILVDQKTSRNFVHNFSLFIYRRRCLYLIDCCNTNELKTDGIETFHITEEEIEERIEKLLTSSTICTTQVINIKT